MFSQILKINICKKNVCVIGCGEHELHETIRKYETHMVLKVLNFILKAHSGVSKTGSGSMKFHEAFGLARFPGTQYNVIWALLTNFFKELINFRAETENLELHDCPRNVLYVFANL